MFVGGFGTFLGTNISPTQGMFEDHFPVPKVGYVSSLKATQIANPSPPSGEAAWPPARIQLDGWDMLGPWCVTPF